MKIAVSATSPSLDAEVDPRFGRCQCFIIVDPETMEFEAVENTNIAAGGGAGIATAQMVAEKGVEVVLTGNCGPNAVRTLSAAGVEVIVGQSGTIRQAVEDYKKGILKSTTQATVTVHCGMGGAGPGGDAQEQAFADGMGMGRGMGCGRGRGGGRGMGRGMGMSRGRFCRPGRP